MLCKNTIIFSYMKSFLRQKLLFLFQPLIFTTNSSIIHYMIKGCVIGIEGEVCVGVILRHGKHETHKTENNR